jgi:predicted TIM-barrel fold metal-dependent hydrolase
MAHIIDIHTHCNLPTRDDPFGIAAAMQVTRAGRNTVSNYRGLPAVGYYEMTDFALQQEVCTKAGITRRLMSNSFTPEVISTVSPKPELDIVKYCNDLVAEIVSRAPGSTFGLGTVNPLDRTQIAEAERCIGALGFKGFLINSSWHGKFIETEETYPFWEWVEDQGIAIFLHPPRAPIGCEQGMDQYKLDELVGRPFDTAMSVARMILSGLFDRYPRLKISLAHMGGGLLPVVGRLNFGWRLGSDGMPDRARIKCQRLPSDYLRQIHVDTMGLWAPHLREAVEVFGADRVMLGTDYGPVPIDPTEHIEMVKALGLSAADEEKILWRNADAFFGLGLEARSDLENQITRPRS